jgi:hypothetical protein
MTQEKVAHWPFGDEEGMGCCCSLTASLRYLCFRANECTPSWARWTSTYNSPWLNKRLDEHWRYSRSGSSTVNVQACMNYLLAYNAVWVRLNTFEFRLPFFWWWIIIQTTFTFNPNYEFAKKVESALSQYTTHNSWVTTSGILFCPTQNCSAKGMLPYHEISWLGKIYYLWPCFLV